MRAQERRRVAEAMDPVKDNANSEAIAKVRINMIMAALVTNGGKPLAKESAVHFQQDGTTVGWL